MADALLGHAQLLHDSGDQNEAEAVLSKALSAAEAVGGEHLIHVYSGYIVTVCWVGCRRRAHCCMSGVSDRVRCSAVHSVPHLRSGTAIMFRKLF